MRQMAEKATSKKQPPIPISGAEQGIQMGKTFKNVAAEIVRMAGLDQKEKRVSSGYRNSKRAWRNYSYR